MAYWGYHALFNCYACDETMIRDRDNIYKFTKELVESIDMVAFGEPMIEHFATHAPDKAGYTLVQMIETSHIAGHFVDEGGDAYIDIFSCKPFDVGTVSEVIGKYFQPFSVQVNFLTRHAHPGAE